MSKQISEFDAKSLLNQKSFRLNIINDADVENIKNFKLQRLVVKPDCLLKRRFKLGILLIN